MADPFAPSTDPDIPTPTREDLLPHVHGSVRDMLAANKLDAAHSANEWAGARRTWDESHKQAAIRRKEQATKNEPTTSYEPPPENLHWMEENYQRSKREQLKKEIDQNSRPASPSLSPRSRLIAEDLARIDALNQAEGILVQGSAGAPDVGDTNAESVPSNLDWTRQTESTINNQEPSGSDLLRKAQEGFNEWASKSPVDLERELLERPRPLPDTRESSLLAVWLFLRRWAAVGGVFLLGASWTMIQIDEYALADVLLLLGMAAFSIQVYDWKGIENHANATRTLKTLAGILVLASLFYFAAVIIKKKESKPWSNLMSRRSELTPIAAKDSDKAKESSAYNSEDAVNQLRKELQADAAKPIRDVGFTIKLDRKYSVDELEHFRIIYEVADVSNHIDFFLACQNMSQINEFFDSNAKAYGTRCTVQYHTSNKGNTYATIPLMGKQKYSGLVTSDYRVDTIEWRLDLYNQIPGYKTLEDLNRKYLFIFVTAPLANKIRNIAFGVNNWELVSENADMLALVNDKPIPPWIMPLTKEEKAIRWKGVYLKNFSRIGNKVGEPERVVVWSLDFELVHPKKLPPLEIRYDPLSPPKRN